MIDPNANRILANRRFAERAFNPSLASTANRVGSQSLNHDSFEATQKSDFIEPRIIITDVFNDFKKLNLSPQTFKKHGNTYFLNCLMQNPQFIPLLCKENNLNDEQKRELVIAKREINDSVRHLSPPPIAKTNAEKEQFNDFVKELQISYRAFVGASNNYTLDSLGTWAFNKASNLSTDNAELSKITPSFFMKGENPLPRVPKAVLTSEAEYGSLLTNARSTLKSNILCQDEAIDSLINKFLYHYCNQTAESHFKKNRESQPWVRCILYGPSGVGKTTAAELLSDTLDRPVIKIDLNAYKTEESVSRFTGAESGRVGFMTGCSVPELIEKSLSENKKPPMIIFDEFEKAHPYIQHMIMGLLDTGKMPKADLTNLDAKGVDIIATTNAGVDQLNMLIEQGIKGSALKQQAELSMEKEFPPEVIGRFNSKVFFKPLEASDVNTIIQNQINKTLNDLKQSRNIDLNLSKDAIQVLKNSVYNPRSGIRALESSFETLLTEAVILHALKYEPESYYLKKPIKISVKADNNSELKFKIEK